VVSLCAIKQVNNRIERREPAACGDEMEAVEFQVYHQGVQIICDGAGLRTSVRIRSTVAPSPPIEGDDLISRLDKARNVLLPAVGIACVRVEQYD
jgi:hypothetical protein